MKIAEKLQSGLSQTAASFASLAKILLMSKPLGKGFKADEGREIVILGNGPSLAETIEKHPDFLSERDLLAVNFAANSPEFRKLMPLHYLLADPHFFEGEKTDANVAKLWENLMSVDWPMVLHVPASRRKMVEQRIAKRGNISVNCFNMTPIEGWQWLRDTSYRNGSGLPRPRNVLIPALMSALRMGYKKIYIAGADHSWSKTLWVDDKNRVVSIQPHFYPDGEDERDRVAQAYAGLHLHDIYLSFSIAFRSYFEVERYARSLGVSILNITPGSFIDAFPRLNI